MLTNLKEEDFLVLRGPLESGRQRPAGLAVAFMLCIPLQALLLALEKFIGGYSVYPHGDTIFQVHLVISIVVAMFSIIYAIPAVYMRSQKVQYLLNTIVSQNLFGASAYILILIVSGTELTTNTHTLITFTYVTLIVGALVFISTCIRFYILLNKGSYQKGSKKDALRNKFETKSLLPVVVTGGIGFVFVLQYVMRRFDLHSVDLVAVVCIFLLVFYTMLFVLPEQLIVLYCKARFDSFNFEQNNRIKPVRDEKGNLIQE